MVVENKCGTNTRSPNKIGDFCTPSSPPSKRHHRAKTKMQPGNLSRDTVRQWRSNTAELFENANLFIWRAYKQLECRSTYNTDKPHALPTGGLVHRTSSRVSHPIPSWAVGHHGRAPLSPRLRGKPKSIRFQVAVRTSQVAFRTPPQNSSPSANPAETTSSVSLFLRSLVRVVCTQSARCQNLMF